MKATEEPVCEHPKCGESATHCCEQCNRYFCSDHGTKGGDRQIQDVGAVAYPNTCWCCGGFDCDAECRGREEREEEVDELYDAEVNAGQRRDEEIEEPSEIEPIEDTADETYAERGI